jgi:O-acetyl-ADP-ribose deacetylase
MTLETKIGSSVIRLIRGDITDTDFEAFVHDIMEDAKLGTGYGGAITARAGAIVQKELDAIGACPKGEAIYTSAGKMKTKHIIHVNGPKFHEEDQEGILKNVVLNSLKLAEEKNITQLAFPPIGTGFYQVDLGLCARVLVDTVSEYLSGSTGLKEVVFVALDTREYKPFEAKMGQGG